MYRSRRLVSMVAAGSILGFSLAGCGGDGSSGDGSTDTQPVSITIVEKNGAITPDDAGRRCRQGSGSADRRLYRRRRRDPVHSIPEHEFEVKAGADKEKLPQFSVDTPGRFVIESHGLDVTLLTLQVS